MILSSYFNERNQLTAAGLGQIIGIKMNYRQSIEKQLIHSIAKDALLSVNTNVGLILKLSSVVMQGKIKPCECHTRFLIFFRSSVAIISCEQKHCQ